MRHIAAGSNVVAGPFVYSLVFGMTVADVSGKAIANLATDELGHPAPVFHGDTLFAESEVLEVRASDPNRTEAWSESIPAPTSRTERWSPSSSGRSWCREAPMRSRRRLRGAEGPVE